MKYKAALVLTTLLAVLCPLSAAVPNGGFEASWSPDGKLIAFVSGLPHGVANIWVMNSDGSSPRQLTLRGGHAPRWIPGTGTIVFTTLRSGSDQVLSIDASAQVGTEKPVDALPKDTISAIWSADSKRIAYLVPSPSGKSRDLWVVDANGENRKGISMNFYVRDYTFSSDGKSIAFIVGRTTGSSLWVADPETKDVDILYKGFCSTPTYSPDGKYLAFASPSAKGEHKIVYIDMTSRLDKRIMAQAFDGGILRWRPDGSGFVFTSSMNGDAGIWTMDINGKNIRRVTDKTIAAFGPAFSVDGKKLLFFATTPKSFGSDIYTAKTDGTSPTALTKTVHSEWAPAWSPNSAKLAVMCDWNNIGKLLVVNPKNGAINNPALIDARIPATVDWSPDGSKLMIAQGAAVFTTPSTSSKPAAKRTVKVSGPVDACWSSDSKSIYFTDWVGTRSGISMIVAGAKDPAKITVGSEKTGKSEKIVDPNAQAHTNMGLAGPVTEVRAAVVDISDLGPQVSPDGSLIAFIRDNQIWTTESNGRQQKQLTNFADAENGSKSDVSKLQWSSDGKLLLFQRFAYDDETGLTFQIWTIEVSSQDARKLYSEKIDNEYGVYAPSITYAPVWTPDGKSILFTSFEAGFPQICTIGSDGEGRKVLVEKASIFPTIAPNGTQLAYISIEQAQERLKILDLASGKTKEFKLN